MKPRLIQFERTAESETLQSKCWEDQSWSRTRIKISHPCISHITSENVKSSQCFAE